MNPKENIFSRITLHNISSSNTLDMDLKPTYKSRHFYIVEGGLLLDLPAEEIHATPTPTVSTLIIHLL